MEIQEVKSFKFGDEIFHTYEDAQAAALRSLFSDAPKDLNVGYFARAILQHKPEVIAILTGTKPRRKRSDAGKPHAKPARGKSSIPEPGGTNTPGGVTVEASSKYKNK